MDSLGLQYPWDLFSYLLIDDGYSECVPNNIDTLTPIYGPSQ